MSVATRRPAYVQKLADSAEMHCERRNEIAQAVRELQVYLMLPKFHNEQWVSVADVLARLPIVFPSDVE